MRWQWSSTTALYNNIIFLADILTSVTRCDFVRRSGDGRLTFTSNYGLVRFSFYIQLMDIVQYRINAFRNVIITITSRSLEWTQKKKSTTIPNSLVKWFVAQFAQLLYKILLRWSYINYTHNIREKNVIKTTFTDYNNV